jgi:hypothetical protein
MFQGTNALISVSNFETEYLTHRYHGQRTVDQQGHEHDNTALGDTNSRRLQQEDVYACMSGSPELPLPNRSQQAARADKNRKIFMDAGWTSRGKRALLRRWCVQRIWQG